MKERPKVGDRVEFRYRGVKIGTVAALAETGVHFLIKMPIGYRCRQRQIGIDAIIQILPEVS
ncbi:hypothetical protein KAT55_07570 [Candidatus Bathyarchaeota archaeon]|nr:hypothetical protein [Candidatus Bathyarchaeota archaeon]